MAVKELRVYIKNICFLGVVPLVKLELKSHTVHLFLLVLVDIWHIYTCIVRLSPSSLMYMIIYTYCMYFFLYVHMYMYMKARYTN